MRWIVGTETPASAANSFWSIPSKARAARICCDVIMHPYDAWDIRVQPYDSTIYMLRVFVGSEAALNIKSDSNGCVGAKAFGSNTAVGRKAVHWFLKRWPSGRAPISPPPIHCNASRLKIRWWR